MTDLLTAARVGGYALCYCESWNLESLQAVLSAAEETQSPIIVGFNGGFLRHESRAAPERLSFYAGFRGAVEESPVPAAFLLNETDDFDQIQRGIELGFNAVMVESDYLEPGSYRELVRQVVDFAHPRGVAVEAQVGRLPHGGEAQPSGRITDPEAARAFVEETGIDALGVSIGNVHIQTRGQANIEWETFARVHQRVQIPLVIHGGTGFPFAEAKRAISLGVAKFNFGTNLKQAYLAALRQGISRYSEPMNPHPFLGVGGPEDILTGAGGAVRQKVKELLTAFTGPGRLPSTRAYQGA